MTNAQFLQDAFGLIADDIVDKAANTYVSGRVSRWPAAIAAAAAVIVVVLLIASPLIRSGDQILKTKYYAIYNSDGVYTMRGGLSDSAAGDGHHACMPASFVKFAGLSDMRRIIFEGELSDRALRIMKGFKKAKYGGILLFDPNNMQDILVPEGTRVNGLITWYGCAYQFEFSNETLSGSLTYDIVDDSESLAERYIQKEEHGITVLSQTFDPERNATETVFQYVSSQHVWKQVVYTVTQGDKSVTFVEDYWNGAEQQVPGSIDFWGTDNGNFFYGSFHNMTERPSVEYLMQFGLKPFEEE